MKKIKFYIIFAITLLLLFVPNNVQAKEKINVYLFRGEGCPHCEEALEFFDNIDSKYKKYFDLVEYEVWYSQDNANLMQYVAEYLGEQASGVPYIVIGEKTFVGYASSYDEKIETAIQSAYESKDYIDVVKKVKKEKNISANDDEKSNKDAKINKNQITLKLPISNKVVNIPVIPLMIALGVSSLLVIGIIVLVVVLVLKTSKKKKGDNL